MHPQHGAHQPHHQPYQQQHHYNNSSNNNSHHQQMRYAGNGVPGYPPQVPTKEYGGRQYSH
jgi:hypothetical protein